MTQLAINRLTRETFEVLTAQIQKLARENSGFPSLYQPFLVQLSQSETSASTEVLLLLNAAKTQVTLSPLDNQVYWLKINSLRTPLSLYRDAYGYVNSARISQSIANYFSSLQECQEIPITGGTQAITWKSGFCGEQVKIIPAVPVDNKAGVRIYYLVADGKGNWKIVNQESDNTTQPQQ